MHRSDQRGFYFPPPPLWSYAPFWCFPAFGLGYSYGPPYSPRSCVGTSSRIPSREKKRDFSTDHGWNTHRKRDATDADCLRHDIPTGLSLKHWDPDERPIIVLGSVFDAHSLGKWIYDWVCFSSVHEPSSSVLRTAADFWQLLIKLAGGMRRAEVRVADIRDEERRELVNDFIQSGERLWTRLESLIEVCEDHMIVRCKSGRCKYNRLKKDAGVLFTRRFFGRDQDGHCAVEKFMAAVDVWSGRFEANLSSFL
jgi:hypothetical protein